MELWIRSQDKIKLVNNCNLYISSEIKNEYIIEDLNNKYLKLGTYKTKERALEVLDEIQNIIIGKYAISLDMKAALSKGITPKEAEKMLLQMAVYEMPKD